jgi:N-acetylneuraminate synthase/N,N'-diacetyllegionaminate synthase
MNKNHVYIIAEAGVNHNGDINLAYKLCDAAKEAGADAVKFQTWKTEKIVTKSASLATYQEHNIKDKQKSQFQMLKDLELSYEDFRKIKAYCDRIGIQFLSTPDEEESLDFLCSLNLPFIKLGSGDVTNIPFLRIVGSHHQNVILSTGMSYLSDVEIAYRTLLDADARSVTLLHCTTNYPCPFDEVNLHAMLTLKNAFHCHVGYSDHTLGIEVPVAAVALGAEVIEKHFTLDRTMDGPDHKASLEPQELKQMVNAIRHIEVALGDGIKRPNVSEKEISSVVLKRIVASCSIKKGELLCAGNLVFKRSNAGIPSKYWDMVNGRTATRDYKEDEPIEI